MIDALSQYKGTADGSGGPTRAGFVRRTASEGPSDLPLNRTPKGISDS